MQGREERNTKRRFAIEALRLFAEKGYDSVSVAEIAESVGCSAPALYKHYKNKQELLEAIIENSENEFNERMKSEHSGTEDDNSIVIECTEEQEIAHVQEIVKNALHIEPVQWFRKMCLVEQFNMPKLGEIYTYRYITYQMERAEKAFKILIENGKIKNINPRMLARFYLAIPILCIGMCDREPDREEECMEIIAEHVREFNKCYRLDKSEE